MTKSQFTRQYKTSVLLFQSLDIPNENIDKAFTHIADEFDNGDLKNASNHLIEVTDKIIEILES